MFPQMYWPTVLWHLHCFSPACLNTVISCYCCIRSKRGNGLKYTFIVPDLQGHLLLPRIVSGVNTVVGKNNAMLGWSLSGYPVINIGKHTHFLFRTFLLKNFYKDMEHSFRLWSNHFVYSHVYPLYFCNTQFKGQKLPLVLLWGFLKYECCY